MIIVRSPDSIYQIEGKIVDGTFTGRWHFSFGNYFDRDNMRFGMLRVFNDDTLSPGSNWPLHPHNDIEVVTYCAAGEFRHADEKGVGGVLRQGDVQHTTVGLGLWHSEINNRPDEPMRFVQMWFLPLKKGLRPAVEQKHIKKEDRTNRLLPLVSNAHEGALPIHSDARVFSLFLEKGRSVAHAFEPKRGGYLYVLDGEGVEIDGELVEPLGAAKVTDLDKIDIKAKGDSEVLLVDVHLIISEAKE